MCVGLYRLKVNKEHKNGNNKVCIKVFIHMKLVYKSNNYCYYINYINWASCIIHFIKSEADAFRLLDHAHRFHTL